MVTIKIKVSEKIVEKVLWLLGQFKKEDIEIVDSDLSDEDHKKYLSTELDRLEAGTSKIHTLEEVDERLGRVIQKYED